MIPKKLIYLKSSDKVISIKGDAPVKSISHGRLFLARDCPAGEIEYYTCSKKYDPFTEKTTSTHKWQAAEILPNKTTKLDLNVVATESLKDEVLIAKLNAVINAFVNKLDNPGVMGFTITVPSNKQEVLEKPVSTAYIKLPDRLLELKKSTEPNDSTERFSKLEID